jgi:hypothetical protein
VSIAVLVDLKHRRDQARADAEQIEAAIERYPSPALRRELERLARTINAIDVKLANAST